MAHILLHIAYSILSLLNILIAFKIIFEVHFKSFVFLTYLPSADYISLPFLHELIF